MLRFIGAITFAFVFFSCSNKSENNLAIFRATSESLQQSNEAIAASSNAIYHALNDRVKDSIQNVHEEIWQPKAILIKEKSTAIFKYIEGLEKALKEEAGLRNENFDIIFKEDNMEAGNRLFVEKNIGIELYEKLNNYKKEMLEVDSQLNNQFEKNSMILTKEFEGENDKPNPFVNTFFKNTPAIAALVMLKKFENNVRVMENMFINFCLNKIYTIGGGWKSFNALIGQSTNIIKAGDKMEIEAGVGVFSVSCNPVITINGKVFNTSESNGVAKYNFKTPLKSGKYSIPVKIEYTAEDGTRKALIKKVDYTVVE